jgi:hypothetical protein
MAAHSNSMFAPVVPQFQFSILYVDETGFWLGLTIGRQELYLWDEMVRKRES